MEYNLEKAIEEMRAGEESGLNYVYSKTYNYVYLRAKNILKKETDIQALTRDVYLQAMENSSEIQKENLYEWLGKCVYTTGCQRLRKKKAREAESLEFEPNELTSRKLNQSEAAVEIIHECLEQLPELYQATTYAFYYDNMSVKLIAELLNTEEGVIRNRLNYVRKYIIQAMDNYHEEKKEKLFFTVDTVCVALRKWSVANCLEMAGVQAVYAEICKVKNLHPSPVCMEGKELAGVNHTFVQHKPEDLSILEEQFALYKEKKKVTIDFKKIGLIAGGVVLVLALVLGGIALFKNLDKFVDNSGKNDTTVENPETPETPDETPEVPDETPEVPDETPETPEVPDETPEVPDETPVVSDGDYIFPESNTRLLTAEEVASKTKEELRLARNEIFARNGAIFGVEDLDQYFRSKSWYTPTVTLDEFYDKVEMTMIEEKNINLIREYEAKF